MVVLTFIVCILTATGCALAPHYAPVIALAGCTTCAMIERHRSKLSNLF